jgi:hypothetical protein
VIGSKLDKQLKEIVRKWGCGKATRQSGSLFKTECNFLGHKSPAWIKNQSQVLKTDHLKKIILDKTSSNALSTLYDLK